MSPAVSNALKIAIAGVAWVSANGSAFLPVFQGRIPLESYHVLTALVSLAGVTVALLAESPATSPLLPAKSSQVLLEASRTRALSERPPPP